MVAKIKSGVNTADLEHFAVNKLQAWKLQDGMIEFRKLVSTDEEENAVIHIHLMGAGKDKLYPAASLVSPGDLLLVQTQRT